MHADASHRRQSRSRSVVLLDEQDDESALLDVPDEVHVEVRPKHERFAQLLQMRSERRAVVSSTNELEVADDEPVPAPASPPSALMRRGSSSSSFAALPTTTQAIRRVMASIDQALEEQRSETMRQEMESREAEKLHHGKGPSGKHAQTSADLENSQIHDEVLQQIQRRSASYHRRRSKHHTGRSHHVPHRVLSHIDLALHHVIPIHEGTENGIERWTQKVMSRGAPMIPTNELLIPDDPITFEVALNDKESKSKKKRAMHAKHQKDLAEAVQVGAQVQRPRLTLQELYKGYEEHVIVVNNALTTLHSAAEIQGSEDKHIARMKERERRGFCYPIEGIKTLFYFPSAKDDEVEPPQVARMRLLQASVRMIANCGLSLSPLVSKFVTSRDHGSLCCGATRDFPTPFEYRVVLTPLQLYLNLDRMFRGVVSPIDVRKIVYVCCDRPQHELIMWGALYDHAMSKRRNRHLQENQNAGLKKKKKNSTGSKKKVKVQNVEDTPFALSDGTSSTESTDDEDAAEEHAEEIDYASFTMTDDAPPRLAQDLINNEYPFHRIDSELHVMIANSRRRRSTYTLTSVRDDPTVVKEKLEHAQNQQQSFERWFHTAAIPVQDIQRRFLALLKLNASERCLMECYHSFLAKEDMDRFRLFDLNKTNGLLPPSETWIPKNVTLGSLEAQENLYSAKMQHDRDAEAMSLSLARFREEFHEPLTNWIRAPKLVEDGTVKSKATDLLYPSKELPERLLSAVEELMDPQWPMVEGWPERDRGGYAVPANAGKDKKKGKAKAKSEGGRQKTLVVNSVPGLMSVAESAIPSKPARTAEGDDEEEEEEAEDPYADWDPLVLHEGQGLYYEAFVRALECSPVFCRAQLGLLFRRARHFPSID